MATWCGQDKQFSFQPQTKLTCSASRPHAQQGDEGPDALKIHDMVRSRSPRLDDRQVKGSPTGRRVNMGEGGVGGRPSGHGDEVVEVLTLDLDGSEDHWRCEHSLQETQS